MGARLDGDGRLGQCRAQRDDLETAPHLSTQQCSGMLSLSVCLQSLLGRWGHPRPEGSTQSRRVHDAGDGDVSTVHRTGLALLWFDQPGPVVGH